MKLLHIDSSILGMDSASRELSAAIVARWQASSAGLEVTYRDLAANPVPHLGPDSLAGIDPAETALAAAMMDEFLAADVVVVGVPMYNFNIPSQLKAWIDRIAVRGKTFHYTATGPEGLAVGKQVAEAIAKDPRNKPSVRGTRPGEPDDIGYMVLYLASDAASFTTGTAMLVDGGASISKT